MSFSTEKVAGAKEDLVIRIPAPDSPAGANSTPEQNVTSSATPKLFAIEVDCEDNPNEDVTCRIYDNAAAPSVGTDHAEVFVPGKRGQKIEFEWPIGIPFSAGLAVAVVKGDGGTGGSDDPTGFVRVVLRVAS